MKKIRTVSIWYMLFLLVLVAPATVHAQNAGGIATGISLGDTPAPTVGPVMGPQLDPGAGMAAGGIPPRMFTPDPNLAYPNISAELVDKATDPAPADPGATNMAQQFLQSIMNFNSGEYQRPAQSGYSKPDANGNQFYEYKPEPGADNAPAVDNHFPRTCDMKNQPIPLNPSGVTAESLVNHTCSPYDDRLTCMVCNLFHEAANEPALGQLAVAQNVMTRVYNQNFPASVCKVVWEKKQYSWTWLNQGDRKNLKASQQKIQHLIDVAQEGMCLGPNGKSNYYNPGPNCKPSWGHGDCDPSKRQNYIGGGQHLFCSIGNNGRVTRSIADVRAAEGNLPPLRVNHVSGQPAGVE